MLDTGSLTLPIGQVARLLGMTEYTFRKKRAELEALGFPKKLPGLKAWSKPAVLSWFASNGNQAATPAIEPSIDIGVTEARVRLEEVYAQ